VSMKAPESLATLLDYGIIQDVVCPLMSGKEAHVYVVVAGGQECVAKVYKEADQRTFKHRSGYTEGRRTRNTRDQRAMSKRTQHGRKMDEDAWRNTEVDMIYRLRDAGVRVPEPINFVDGVLVMEFLKGPEGHAAPRLGDLSFSASEAHAIYLELIREVVRMLCAGVIHGDLSDFNVLMSHDGPVLIDFPQSVDPAHNPNGKELLLRDVANLHRFLARFAPDQPMLPYGEEIWSLFEGNRLQPDSELTGCYLAPDDAVDTEGVMELIEDAGRDEERRRRGPKVDDDEDLDFEAARALVTAPAPFRTVVDFEPEGQSKRPAKEGDSNSRKARPARARRAKSAKAPRSPKSPKSDKAIPQAAPVVGSAAKNDASPTSRRRRRGRKRSAELSAEAPQRAPRSETTNADAAKPAASQSRRRRGRGRTRGNAATDETKPNSRSNPAKLTTAPNSPNPPNSAKAGQATRPARPTRRTRPARAATPEGAQGAKAGRAAGEAGARGETKAKPAPSPSGTRTSREGDGADRPPRRRRRRPRKSSPPK
jgi:RIO kinase 1